MIEKHFSTYLYTAIVIYGYIQNKGHTNIMIPEDRKFKKYTLAATFSSFIYVNFYLLDYCENYFTFWAKIKVFEKSLFEPYWDFRTVFGIGKLG